MEDDDAASQEDSDSIIIEQGAYNSENGFILEDNEDSLEKEPMTALNKELKAELKELDIEIKDVERQKEDLNALLVSLRKTRQDLVASALLDLPKRSLSINGATQSKTKSLNVEVVDYESKNFPWKERVREVAARTFGIHEFRLNQKAAINANMDGKDMVVVMPTGGGKSLIYQLPALLCTGTTVVITPLISLMQDQTYNLTRQGVRAEMLNASTTPAESRAIMKRMVRGGLSTPASTKHTASVKHASKVVPETSEEIETDLDKPEDGVDIKLIYITPERVDKSKTLISTLQKMYDAGVLPRIVIDEAHCVSSLGHDYRSSYLCLGKLKALFPKTPICTVTATAPQDVIHDMLKILGMPREMSLGRAAKVDSTVLFTSPLYRPNLHYSVVEKPPSLQESVSFIANFIMENHAGECGIVYCLSRADTEAVAKGLKVASSGEVRSAVYHAYIPDGWKLQIHKDWREKRIQVVCATNASFGLGIDAPHVRFVIHHTVSKSIANLYQESGRAGRDGLDANCVFMYRSADASRLSTLIYSEFYNGGKEKLYQVLDFMEDLVTCRKIVFGRYFATAYADRSAFESEDRSEKACGHCDNCLRDPASITAVDVTVDAYRALRTISEAVKNYATLTLPQASDLVRGLGGGAFATQGGSGKGKGKINVKSIAGSTVSLSKAYTECMLLRLLMEGYIEEEFHATAYNTLSYLRHTNKATRFTRISPEDMAKGVLGFKLLINIRTEASKGKRAKAENSSARPVKKKREVIDAR